MNKPARLYKKDPITITLTPVTLIDGILLIIIMVTLAFGSIDNINYLMLGV